MSTPSLFAISLAWGSALTLKPIIKPLPEPAKVTTDEHSQDFNRSRKQTITHLHKEHYAK